MVRSSMRAYAHLNTLGNTKALSAYYNTPGMPAKLQTIAMAILCQSAFDAVDFIRPRQQFSCLIWQDRQVVLKGLRQGVCVRPGGERERVRWSTSLSMNDTEETVLGTRDPDELPQKVSVWTQVLTYY
ncbi:hypothetical protein TREMEDRAFT_63623 [Tremella mesenterica DSM 1558]|uniref:uncharacterized protein n=1 Tax=Tremella mesenterica (strain ATCC 24925 / CBS 8224 / DSM 1558 / NBRC 9311 / NRRL Y-6157 / RJB 2259-6 / UBC 559-6) TaxID=578456 RepID=UPI0003F495BD|nr:uncharacterized protein TREMEDRAFT_63623 [Tremella mesenterica DSM 1558]EIW68454.1 hypothetical protein TREMEDRAFT_63623 [Tremella mesenterica DSM 1558]